MEFTSAETLGVEGEGVEAWGCLAGFAVDGEWIEPTISSTGVFAGGLGKELEGSSHTMFWTRNRPSTDIRLN